MSTALPTTAAPSENAGPVGLSQSASILGCLVYLNLLNPLSYTSSGPYRFLTASLPAALCAAISYVLVTKLIGPRAGARLLQRRGPE